MEHQNEIIAHHRGGDVELAAFDNHVRALPGGSRLAGTWTNDPVYVVAVDVCEHWVPFKWAHIEAFGGAYVEGVNWPGGYWDHYLMCVPHLSEEMIGYQLNNDDDGDDTTEWGSTPLDGRWPLLCEMEPADAALRILRARIAATSKDHRTELTCAITTAEDLSARCVRLGVDYHQALELAPNTRELSLDDLEAVLITCHS